MTTEIEQHIKRNAPDLTMEEAEIALSRVQEFSGEIVINMIEAQ